MGSTTYSFYCNSTDILHICYSDLWNLQTYSYRGKSSEFTDVELVFECIYKRP